MDFTPEEVRELYVTVSSRLTNLERLYANDPSIDLTEIINTLRQIKKKLFAAR
jgi:hypothetical protein